MPPPSMPWLAGVLLRFVLPEDEAEFILGDLAEGFRKRWLRDRVGAQVWHWGQVLASMPTFLRLRMGTGKGLQVPGGGLGGLGLDVGQTLRGLIRSPGYTLTSLLTLSLALGGCAIILGVVRPVLLVPLPYLESDRLVVLSERAPGPEKAEPIGYPL